MNLAALCSSVIMGVIYVRGLPSQSKSTVNLDRKQLMNLMKPDKQRASKEPVMKSGILLATIFLLLAVSIVACAQPTPRPIVSPISPVASPAVIVPTNPPAFVVPTSQPNTGTTFGRLIVQDTKAPMAGRFVYLAVITDSSEGNFSAGALRQDSPMAVTDSDGRFAFASVQPGRYALILEAVTDTVLLSDLTTSKPIIITISANKTVDLGTIEVLPGY
jgi:hypothetical protein